MLDLVENRCISKMILTGIFIKRTQHLGFNVQKCPIKRVRNRTLFLGRNKGFNRKDAIDKALNYGISVIKDVENKEELGLFFKDIASAYDSLGELLLKKAH